MPLVINEVIAEIEPTVTPGTQSAPPEQQQALAQTEADWLDHLALIEERRQRLAVD